MQRSCGGVRGSNLDWVPWLVLGCGLAVLYEAPEPLAVAITEISGQPPVAIEPMC